MVDCMEGGVILALLCSVLQDFGDNDVLHFGLHILEIFTRECGKCQKLSSHKLWYVYWKYI
jgi:hypothetical protein